MYKSPPYYPPNGTWSPQYSFDQTDFQFLVKNGFSVIRLFVAWPGVEPTRGVYNQSYLNVRVLFVGVCPCYMLLVYLWICVYVYVYIFISGLGIGCNFQIDHQLTD